MLAEPEASGDAVRFVNSTGGSAGEATPRLRDYLKGVKLDQDDLEDI
jgi:hypothetical protein